MITTPLNAAWLTLVCVLLLAGCGGGGSGGASGAATDDSVTDTGASAPPAVGDDIDDRDESDGGDQPSTPTQDPVDDFRIASMPSSSISLQEGGSPLTISVPVEFVGNYDAAIQLSIDGDSTDLANLATLISDATVTPAEASPIDESTRRLNVELTLTLGIGQRPLLRHARSLTIVATSGGQTRRKALDIDVLPTTRPDIYLLIGQSNMEGESAGGKNLSAADATDPRIRQLNVTANTTANFSSASAYTSRSANVVSPALIVAEDPLHEPLQSGQSSKAGTDVGSGLSFAKAARLDTSAEIVLVPAAYGDTGFCQGPIGRGHWNPTIRNVGDLGRDTLMYERALLRTKIAIEESGGILRGIIMHQGERDSVESLDCARYYSENLSRLVTALRSNIVQDARGSAARGASSDVPFVLGTMSRGNDADAGNGRSTNWGAFGSNKTMVDAAHRSVASLVPHAEFANFDDLVPPGYSCGSSSCIHFGAAAYRQMGSRYYEAMQRAYDNE